MMVAALRSLWANNSGNATKRMDFMRLTIDAVQKFEVTVDLADPGTDEYQGMTEAYSESGISGAKDWDLDAKGEENATSCRLHDWGMAVVDVEL